MRCYQHIGLTEKAKTFLNENVNIIPDIVCPKCDEVITTKMQKSENLIYFMMMVLWNMNMF